MIDTDKYEGHLASEGQTWAWSKWMLKNAESKEQMDATAELLKDAPLLLEEVLRLERELDTQYEYIEWLEEFAPKAGDYNTVWDAYELAKGIHWTQVEGEE
tara:strand:+ start:268 stop:570 length:303 start_codon:yes stop_codon:yes gene_type:complete